MSNRKQNGSFYGKGKERKANDRRMRKTAREPADSEIASDLPS